MHDSPHQYDILCLNHLQSLNVINHNIFLTTCLSIDAAKKSSSSCEKQQRYCNNYDGSTFSDVKPSRILSDIGFIFIFSKSLPGETIHTFMHDSLLRYRNGEVDFRESKTTHRERYIKKAVKLCCRGWKFTDVIVSLICCIRLDWNGNASVNRVT